MKKFIIFLMIAFVLPALVDSQDFSKQNPVRNPIGPNTFSGPELPIPFVATFGPESFENPTFPPAGWTKLNPIGGTGWLRITNGTVVPGWGTAVVSSSPPGGGTAIAYATYINGGTSANDMWLITPQIMNINLSDSLIFWIKKWPGVEYADNVDIKISTTNNSTPAAFTYTVALLVFPGVSDTAWTRKAYRLGNVPGLTAGSNIYVGFREHVANNLSDGDVIGIDMVSLVEDLTGINQIGTEIPSAFELEQNYPNPFNPSTNINFSLPVSGNVKLAVYDMLGNEVAVLHEGFQKAGNYSAKFNSSNLASGTYFYRLNAGSFTDTKKMVLIK
jgi:hypothetical protein